VVPVLTTAFGMISIVAGSKRRAPGPGGCSVIVIRVSITARHRSVPWSSIASQTPRTRSTTAWRSSLAAVMNAPDRGVGLGHRGGVVPWWVLIEALVRPVVIEMADILVEDGAGVSLVVDQ
jgi:hypothetical protein